MLQAWITAPHGSLYFAAPVTAYNLATLRMHTRALRNDEGRTCLSLSLGGAVEGTLAAKVSALIDELTREGIHVRVFAAADQTAASGRGGESGGGGDGTRGSGAPRPAFTRLRRRGGTARRARPSSGTAEPRGATSGNHG